MPLRYLIAMSAFMAAASAQVSSNASLSGQYYFRQIMLVTDSGGVNVNTTSSAWGTLTFDGNGNFTINGQQMTGTAAPTALSGSRTYTVKAGGFTTLSSPLLASATVNARLGVGALVGSSTEAGPTLFDLFLAIPAGSIGTLNGSYWISSLEFPNGGTTNIRNTNFKLTANGAGTFAENTVTGQAKNLGNVLSNQTVSPMTYLISANAGTLTFPLAAGRDVATQLISGVKEIYISSDGSYFIGGSTTAGGHGVVVGVKAFAGGASWSGFYYSAGMRFDADSSRLAAVSGGVNATGLGSVWGRRTRQSDGVFDASLLLTYSLGADGSGTYQSTSGHVDVASTGQVFATSGVGVASVTSYELYFGARIPSQSGTGVFLNPQGVQSSATFAPPGTPIAPGMYIELNGSGFGTVTTSAFPFPPILSGVQVKVNGIVAPIWRLSPTLITAVVPYGVTGSTANIVVTVNNTNSNPVEVPLAATAPGIFSRTSNGVGDGAIRHIDGSLVDVSKPAKGGEIVTVYLTGLGAFTPSLPDGIVAPDTPFSVVNSPVAVTIGGLPSSLTYKLLTPTVVALYVLAVTVPSGLAPGAQSLAVQTVEGFTDMVNIQVSP